MVQRGTRWGGRRRCCRRDGANTGTTVEVSREGLVYLSVARLWSVHWWQIREVPSPRVEGRQVLHSVWSPGGDIGELLPPVVRTRD